MGNKKKLFRYAQMETFSNVFQPSHDEAKKGNTNAGKWQEIFGNDNPIIVELGCGKGEFTVGLARKNLNYNYIGIDIKGARIWFGAKDALEEGLDNVRFLRSQIDYLPLHFAEGEIAEIWITFPDPQLKVRRMKKRLTSPQKLIEYKILLKPNGIVNLKTDSVELFEYTVGIFHALAYEILAITKNVDHNDSENSRIAEASSIRTHYEELFRGHGKTINYVAAKLNS